MENQMPWEIHMTEKNSKWMKECKAFGNQIRIVWNLTEANSQYVVI